MSAQTAEALEQAVREHLADELDGVALTAWVAIAVGICLDNTDPLSFYLRAGSDGPLHERLGLIRYLALRAEQEAFDDLIDGDGP